LIADALRCEPGRAAPLTQLVHEKTTGNPFFVIQFLYALAEEHLLAFDHGSSCWTWDLERIREKGYTDNVVDLMVGRLTRLPAETQKALQLLACLGNAAEITMLSIVLGTSAEQVQAALFEAVRQELVERLDGSYRFIHDRVHEAAYSLIPEASRAADHLRIGRLLAVRTPPEQREEAIFEIVNQLNRGAALITAREECEQLAELNLIAGKRAKASTAYAAALTYLIAGMALLEEDCWERRHQLSFALELHRAECEVLTGELMEAEQRLDVLSTRAATTVDRATVACLRADLYCTLDQSSRAIAVGLNCLRHLGIDWSPHPTDKEAAREYEQIWSQLGSRMIEDLIELPLMSDAESLATLDVLTKLGPPALHTDANLFSLVMCRAVNLSLENGNCDGSCFAYVRLGMVAGPRFNDYQAGFRFGRLGHDLVEQQGLKRFQARAYMCFSSFVMPWTKHVRAGRDLLRRALQAANEIGDFTYVAYSGDQLITNLLAAGDPLVDVQREGENVLAFAQKAQFGFVIDIAAAQLGLIRTLRGLTPTFGSFTDGHFDELRVERRFTRNPDLAHAECWYWTRKLQARFFAGAAVSDPTSGGDHRQHIEALAAHYKQLKVWAERCPDNFENRAALVGAEIARLEGRDRDAMDLYEQAIRSSQANGFVHNEALAYELAARFYAMRGFEEFARVYLRNARDRYLHWRADGKVRQLDQLYPPLSKEERVPATTGAIGAPVEHLDLATVIKVSQAVSSEIVLDKLLHTLLRTALEHAGTQRGLLILSRGTERRIAAEATTSGETVTVQLSDEAVTAAALPELILQYVLHTQETVVLDDAATPSQFSGDPYIHQRQARSILCLPLTNQVRLIGILYLENNLASRVFAPDRTAVLKLLASQAATSLENTRLYRDLAEREAKIRRLVDANIIGIFIWDIEGQILEANDAFLHMVGYDREDLVAGRLRWTDLNPPELRDRFSRQLRELKMTGTVQPYEKEYLHKNGARVPVFVGGASIDDAGSQGLAFVLDLTELKRAEEERRESERRFREVQMELAHANRVAIMGQLTASIAHEVKQPIAATITNAEAGRRWLDRQPSNLEESRQAFDRIVSEGNRANEVIGRIRALIKKEAPRNDRLDINGAIGEVIELTRGETMKNRVSVRTDLAGGLPPIEGDRVQVQQVILNLVINAIEAMSSVREEARELLINTRKTEAGGVLVAVRDSGSGLDSQSVGRLFEAFYTTKPGGLGMGLAICRSIIEAH
jgi:PAS domain S-box-containing protein